MAEREEDAFERKESKKDKGYVAFRSDDDSVGEEEEEDLRYVFNDVEWFTAQDIPNFVKQQKRMRSWELLADIHFF